MNKEDLAQRIAQIRDYPMEDLFPNGMELNSAKDLDPIFNYMEHTTKQLIQDLITQDHVSVLKFFHDIIQQDNKMSLEAIPVMLLFDRSACLSEVSELLRKANPERRGTCCLVIAEHIGSDIESILIDHLEHEADGEARCCVVIALGKCGTSKSLPVLEFLSLSSESSTDWEGNPINWLVSRSIQNIKSRSQ